MAAHSGPSTAQSQAQSKKIQTNIIKAMLLVSVLFAVTWAPAYIYLFLINANAELAVDALGTYTLMGIGQLYNCINPFIYATSFDPVKRVLLLLIPCTKTAVHPVDVT